MGQSSLPIWLLGTIEFVWAGWIPLNPHHKIIPLQKYVFRDSKIGQKTSPGQNVDLGVSKSDPGLPNLEPGMKKQKMRAEKPCRTPPSKNQTEPYSASYCQKPFWGVPFKIRVYARAIWEIWKQSGYSLNGIWELAGALGSQGWPTDDLKGKCVFSIVKIDEQLQKGTISLTFRRG